MSNLFTIALLVVIAVNLLLGAFVYVTHTRRSANRVFAVLSLLIALWLACQFFGSIASGEDELAFWIRQACAISVFIPFLFFMLCGAVVEPSGTLGHFLRKAWWWVVAGMATTGLCQTGFFLTGAHLATASNAIGEPVYGPGFLLFVGYWIIAVAVLVWNFFRSVARAEGVRRMELQFMAFGSFFGLVPGVLLVLLIPLLTASSQSARFTPITVVIWHSAIAYGIATRHIMGMGELLRRTITYVLLAGLLILLYLLVFRLIQSLPFDSDALRQTAAHVVAAIAVALALAPVNQFLQHRADSLFADGHDELATLLRQGSELSRTLNAVDALLNDFGRLLQDTLDLSSVRIFLRHNERFVPRYCSGDAEPGGGITDTDSLLGVLRTERSPLLRDVLRRAGNVPQQTEAERALARLGAEAAIALRARTGLAGFILLGRRHNGRIFGKREEDALALLGGQLGIAIENATLYTRLQDARVYNEVLLDNLVTGVVAADPLGCVTVCNREAQRILRLAGAGAPIGRPAADILPGSLADALRASLSSGQSVRDVNSVLWPQTADEQPVRYATAVFGGGGGAAPGALLVLQDTSAIRRLEEQIRRSDRLASIGTLAAGMAHEIKNPLVCLKTFVQLLPDHYDDPDFRNTFTPLLGNEVERIDAIVSQLLNFSRPVKPRLVPMSLHTVLDAAWLLVAQQAKTKGLAFERQYAAENDTLLGDQRLLGQVFLNLLLNGIDAMEPGGTLTVSTRGVGYPEQVWRLGRPDARAWIDVQVRDTGCGIAPSDLPRVFDPFFTTKTSGTGLGLSVAHGLVMDHHGVIDVESAPGQGTCFHVLLPLLPAENPGTDKKTKGAA